MQCPLCHTEMKIRSNKLVEKTDGTLAYRMDFECRSKECPNYGKLVDSQYDPVVPEKDE
jgi:hypothetical protein